MDKKRDRTENLMSFSSIRARVKAGESLHRACAEVAAREVGHRGSSFEAAIKDLKKLYKREEAANLPLEAIFNELKSWRSEVDGLKARAEKYGMPGTRPISKK